MEKLERMLEEAEKKKHGTFGENRRQGMLKETLLLDICLWCHIFSLKVYFCVKSLISYFSCSPLSF